MEQLLDIDKAGEVLGISPWTVRAYIRDQKLIPVRLGRRVLLEPSELRRFVQDAKQTPVSAASTHDVTSGKTGVPFEGGIQ